MSLINRKIFQTHGRWSIKEWFSSGLGHNSFGWRLRGLQQYDLFHFSMSCQIKQSGFCLFLVEQQEGTPPPTPSHCIILARTLSIADSFSVCHWWLLLDFLIHEPDCVACSYFHHPLVSKVVWGPCSRQN